MRTEIIVYNSAGIFLSLLSCWDAGVACRAIIKLEKLGFSWKAKTDW